MLDASGFASGAQKINSHLGEMGIRTNAASANLGGIGTLLGTLANPLTMVAMGITAIGGALVGSAQAAAAWETSMSGVAKTTGMGGAELAALSQELLTMSTNMPIAASELANIAQAGGSLGIAKEELGGFTEVAAQMGIGFNMAADQAATAGAKILNAFGQPMNTENLRSLGSVVNSMGDNFAATEPQVLDFINRASFLNTTMGQSIPQVAALGTTLISAGLDAEVAATGIKSMLNMLTSETSKKGGMDNWAKLMGVSVDELKEKVATDLNSTLIETANKIASLKDPVERFQTAVAAAGTEGAPALLKLAGQQENYAKALGMTNSEWEKANSLQKTYEAQAGTVNSQWQMFSNTLSVAATSLGTTLLPALGDALGFMNDLAKVGIKVGETLSEALAPVGKLLSSGDSGPSGFGMAWDAVKDWAGTGDAHADTMAKEIKESESLQNAAAEAIKAGEDAGVFASGEAGENMGAAMSSSFEDKIKELKGKVSEELIPAIAGGMSDLEAMASYNTQYTRGDVKDKTFLRELEIEGKKIALDLRATAQGLYEDIWTIGDAKTSTTGLGGKETYNPLEAFEIATGLPAPEVGTAEYFRLMGDKISAEQVELRDTLEKQEKAKPLWDMEAMGEGLKGFSPDTQRKTNDLMGAIEGQIKGLGDSPVYADLKEKWTQSGQDLVDAFAGPVTMEGFAKLQMALEENGEWIKKWGGTLGDYAGDAMKGYTDKLIAQIYDGKQVTEDAMKGLSSDAKEAFNGEFTEEEKSLLLAYEPQLQLLKKEFPEAFAEAGGDSSLALINAIKSGDIPGALALLGKESGKAFIDGITGANLGEGETRTLADIIAGGAKGIGDQKAFMENTFQPALKSSFDEMHKIADSGYTEDIKLADAWISDKQKLYEDHASWFTDQQASLLQANKAGLLSDQDFFDQWANAQKEGIEKVADAKKTAAEGSGLYYGDPASGGSWENYVNEEGGYIGPTKYYGGYKDSVMEEQRLAQEVNEKYGITTVGSIGMTAELDTAPARTEADQLVSDIQTNQPEMTLLLDTTIADARFMNFYTMVENAQPTMTVMIDLAPNAAQLEEMVYSYVASALASGAS
jgi:TP901 family phage tail tape measure protein